MWKRLCDFHFPPAACRDGSLKNASQNYLFGCFDWRICSMKMFLEILGSCKFMIGSQIIECWCCCQQLMQPCIHLFITSLSRKAVHICLLRKMCGASWKSESNDDLGLLISWNVTFRHRLGHQILHLFSLPKYDKVGVCRQMTGLTFVAFLEKFAWHWFCRSSSDKCLKSF